MVVDDAGEVPETSHVNFEIADRSDGDSTPEGSIYELDALTDTLDESNKAVATTFTTDPFQPFNDIVPDEHRILTIRAVIVGSLFGALVNASNIYLGLKAGWTTSANIFGSIGGFAVLKMFSQRFPNSSILGGSFGPHENNIVQTAATAAGGMSSVFVSAIPAMYQLGLLTSPMRDFFRIFTLTITGGCFGLLSAAPLRRFFILTAAKDLRLVFPSSSATAITIRGMHLAADGSDAAWKTMRALAISFIVAAGVRIASQYALGVFWDWHIFTWVAVSGIAPGIAIGIESWGWFIEWTPAFIGSGMLVGLNVAISFTMGSVLAWGVIGPILVSRGMAFGVPASTDPEWQRLMSYSSLSKDFASANHPSPRYWLLWPGVACMIAAAFTELALQWRIFWILGRNLFAAIRTALSDVRQNKYKYRTLTSDQGKDRSVHRDLEFWMWLPGLVLVVCLTCAVTKLQYDMSVLESLLALLLAFILSLTAIQATGATDTTPLTAVSKVTQVILGTTTRTTSSDHRSSQRLNLLGGALTSVGANQACDLIGDFRVGFLLTTPPTLQFATQLIGTAFASLIAPLVFTMFASAYPCILSAESDESCPFPAPSVSAWRAVAVAATEDELPIPRSSINFSILMALLGVASILVKQYVWTGRREWVKAYHPSIMIIALAFTLPATQYGIAMLMGAVIARSWSRRNPGTFETYSYAIAAGCMAGEGVGGALNAIMAVVGIGGDRWGTSLGCPAGRC